MAALDPNEFGDLSFLDKFTPLDVSFMSPLQRRILKNALDFRDAVQQQEEERRERLAEEQQRAERRRNRRRRAIWVREWIQRRDEKGQFYNLIPELRQEDPKSFQNYFRMPQEMFDEIVQRVGPRVQKQDTTFRKAIPSDLKVAITLRYLATGALYKSLAYEFRVAHNTICGIIPEVCNAILEEFKDECIQPPSTKEAWKAVADGYAHRWNFHHCLGAIDGKHIALRKPGKSGSMYFNYKKFFSVVLMALVDSDYKFLWVDIGGPGSSSDAGIFLHSELREVLEGNEVDLPDPEPLPNDTEPIPYFIIGDDAFPLRQWCMKPYSRSNMAREARIFNYRLSRARRVVENAFGILSQKFMCLRVTMPQRPDRVETIVLACVVLHNLIRMRFRAGHDPDVVDTEDPRTHHLIPGSWRQGVAFTPLAGGGFAGNRELRVAKVQREVLCKYYNSEAGRVAWQENMI